MEETLPDKSGVYLLHFTEPYPEGRRPQHYIGYADNIRRRVDEHRKGCAACLTRALREKGITFVVAAFWIGESRTEERQRKRQKKGGRHYCPLCNPKRKENDCHVD